MIGRHARLLREKTEADVGLASVHLLAAGLWLSFSGCFPGVPGSTCTKGVGRGAHRSRPMMWDRMWGNSHDPAAQLLILGVSRSNLRCGACSLVSPSSTQPDVWGIPQGSVSRDESRRGRIVCSVGERQGCPHNVTSGRAFPSSISDARPPPQTASQGHCFRISCERGKSSSAGALVPDRISVLRFHV